MFTKKNETTKALCSACYDAMQAAKFQCGINSSEYKHAHYEYELAVRTSDSRKMVDGNPEYRNMPFSEICDTFSRKYGGHCGATKRTHVAHPDGWDFTFFVVKRYKWHGHEFWGEGCGNQLIDEINCWVKLSHTPDADYLCPIIKYETAKSDKCKPLSDTMKERVCIIAQKAVHTDNLEGACKNAEMRNRLNGYNGTNATQRKREMLEFANRMGWWDVEHNPGNSGVIFDYAQQCYKAVFIDYAL